MSVAMLQRVQAVSLLNSLFTSVSIFAISFKLPSIIYIEVCHSFLSPFCSVILKQTV